MKSETTETKRHTRKFYFVNGLDASLTGIVKITEESDRVRYTAHNGESLLVYKRHLCLVDISDTEE